MKCSGATDLDEAMHLIYAMLANKDSESNLGCLLGRQCLGVERSRRVSPERPISRTGTSGKRQLIRDSKTLRELGPPLPQKNLWGKGGGS